MSFGIGFSTAITPLIAESDALKDISQEKFSYLLIILTLELSGMVQIDY